MKRTFSLTIIAVLTMMIGFSSCKKYEDGPAFTLVSKTSRLVNTWKFETVISNGTDATNVYTLLFPDYTAEFKKDDHYIISWTSSIAETGQWGFDSNKENVLLTPDGGNIASKWKILRLTSNELWAEYTKGGDNLEVHLVTK